MLSVAPSTAHSRAASGLARRLLTARSHVDEQLVLMRDRREEEVAVSGAGSSKKTAETAGCLDCFFGAFSGLWESSPHDSEQSDYMLTHSPSHHHGECKLVTKGCETCVVANWEGSKRCMFAQNQCVDEDAARRDDATVTFHNGLCPNAAKIQFATTLDVPKKEDFHGDRHSCARLLVSTVKKMLAEHNRDLSRATCHETAEELVRKLTGTAFDRGTATMRHGLTNLATDIVKKRNTVFFVNWFGWGESSFLKRHSFVIVTTAHPQQNYLAQSWVNLYGMRVQPLTQDVWTELVTTLNQRTTRVCSAPFCYPADSAKAKRAGSLQFQISQPTIDYAAIPLDPADAVCTRFK
jgi:hypothetical protein